MLQSPEFWLAVALIVLIVAVWKPASRGILGALDARSARIRQELDDAKRLHEEAKTLVARYQRQLHEGEALAAEILERAEAESARLEAKMRQDFDATVARRTQQAMDRIAQEEQRALMEVRARAADLAVRTTRRLLSEQLGPDQAQRLIGGAIEDVSRKLA
jgi:F-type H+-transporting ATPase subunit b